MVSVTLCMDQRNVSNSYPLFVKVRVLCSLVSLILVPQVKVYMTKTFHLKFVKGMISLNRFGNKIGNYSKLEVRFSLLLLKNLREHTFFFLT